MPAGDVFGLDGFFLNKSNPITVSTIGINSTGSSAGIIVTAGTFSVTAGIATLTLSTAAGLSTTPFYVGAKIAVSGLRDAAAQDAIGYNGNFVVTGFAGTTTVSYASTGYFGVVTASITAQTGRVVLVTDTQVTNTTWSSIQTHGWFGGGRNPGPAASTVDRVDFSNDTGTANIRGSLSAGRYGVTATGNSNYGWFGGGSPQTSQYASTVDRIDFSNDSATPSVRGPLSSERRGSDAIGNSNYGWYISGADSSGARSTIDRINFSNDSGTASPRAQTPTLGAAESSGTTGNSNFGWFGSGSNSISSLYRIDFSNDFAAATLRGPLSLARFQVAATGNSNYGWFGGGRLAPIYSRVDRIDFANDLTTASVRSPLSAARYGVAATGNSNYGWWGGGVNPGVSPSFFSTVDRIDFSNDLATASPRGPLTLARTRLAATSGQARSSSTRLQKTGNYGWFGGGFIPSSTATVDRINFSNDSASASPRGSLFTARDGLTATGNSNYGWFGGGTNPGTGHQSTIDRIDFSNDSPAGAVSKGPLTRQKTLLAATGNSNYGYFGGGYVTTPTIQNLSSVDRIDFSNDLTTTSPRGPLFTARKGLTATGNSNYGWWAGSWITSTASAIVNRIDFSNDSATASVRGSLSAARGYLASTGNSNYGWFGGGEGPSFTILATVDRIDFSNDLTNASIRSPLTATRYEHAATGNSNYGWFGGGNNPVVATVERINFSNDSVSASPRGSISTARRYLAATSNSTR